MAKKRKTETAKVKIPTPFRADPEDDVCVINGKESKKEGPFIPKLHIVKRRRLNELRSRGWKYLPDFYRDKAAERQKILDAYDEMFNFMSDIDA